MGKENLFASPGTGSCFTVLTSQSNSYCKSSSRSPVSQKVKLNQARNGFTGAGRVFRPPTHFMDESKEYEQYFCAQTEQRMCPFFSCKGGFPNLTEPLVTSGFNSHVPLVEKPLGRISYSAQCWQFIPISAGNEVHTVLRHPR